jgi:hypothetical protein
LHAQAQKGCKALVPLLPGNQAWPFSMSSLFERLLLQSGMSEKRLGQTSARVRETAWKQKDRREGERRRYYH